MSSSRSRAVMVATVMTSMVRLGVLFVNSEVVSGDGTRGRRRAIHRITVVSCHRHVRRQDRCGVNLSVVSLSCRFPEKRS